MAGSTRIFRHPIACQPPSYSTRNQTCCRARCRWSRKLRSSRTWWVFFQEIFSIVQFLRSIVIISNLDLVPQVSRFPFILTMMFILRSRIDRARCISFEAATRQLFLRVRRFWTFHKSDSFVWRNLPHRVTVTGDNRDFLKVVQFWYTSTQKVEQPPFYFIRDIIDKHHRLLYSP